MQGEALIREDIERVTVEIWRDMLELELLPTDTQTSNIDAEVYVSSVELSGAWNGYVAIVCSKTLAEQARTQMFLGSDSDLGEYHTEDVMRELANMTGGNLKNAVPEPTILSLPKVRTVNWGKWKQTLTDERLEFSYLCNGEPYYILVGTRNGVSEPM